MEPPPLQKSCHPLIPKIYMVGKMGNPNFRNTLGLGPRDMASFAKKHSFHGWEYIYLGPIVPSCDHGCWHSICSGNIFYEGGMIDIGEHSFHVETSSSAAIVAANISQLRQADMIFAWFDGFDAFGSMVEIGFAAALDIPIYIGFRDDVFPERDIEAPQSWEGIKSSLPGQELWYIGEIAEKAFLASTPQQAFFRALRMYTKDEPASWKSILKDQSILFPGKTSR